MTEVLPFRLRPDLVERYTNRLTTTPVGCAFLATADAAGMTLDEIVEPNTALQLLGAAADQTQPHAQDFLERSEEALSHGPDLARLARELMRLREAHAWWAPLDRDRQVWTSLSADIHSLDMGIFFDDPLPGSPIGKHYVFTSTQVDDVASLDIAWVWDMAMDQMGGDGPISRTRMTVTPTARVCEIREFDDWRQLIGRYPSKSPDTHENRTIRQENPAYDWFFREVRLDLAATARDWDGIHFSFGGVLLSTAIVGSVPGGWSWIVAGSERTHWLNHVVTSREPLLDVDGQLERLHIDRRSIPMPIENGVQTWSR